MAPRFSIFLLGWAQTRGSPPGWSPHFSLSRSLGSWLSRFPKQRHGCQMTLWEREKPPLYFQVFSHRFLWASFCFHGVVFHVFSFIFFNNSDVSIVPEELFLSSATFGECVPFAPRLCFQQETPVPSSLYFTSCPFSFFFFPMQSWMVKTGEVRVTLILAVNSFLILHSPSHSNPWVKCLGYKSFPGGVVPSLPGSWVTFYMWQAHGCTFCLCVGLDVDWQGTNSNSILYSQSSTKPYSSLGSKGWTEGLEKLGVPEWVLIFNSALIHLRGREGRPWVVQSLWGVSDTLKAFLPSSVAVPWSNRNRGPHRKRLSFKI